MAQSSSAAGIPLLQVLARHGLRWFRAGDAQELATAAGLSAGYVPEALHHLARSGWLLRLRRGLYVLNPELFGEAPLHEFELVQALAEPAAVSHWSALVVHELTDQIPGVVWVTTTSEGTAPRVATRVRGVEYRFHRVLPERFFGVEEIWFGPSRVPVTDPERTLLDGLTNPGFCGDFPEVMAAFHARGDRLRVERIVDYALQLDRATAKRLGWVLEHLGLQSDQLDRLRAVPLAGFCPLDSSGPRRGSCDPTWQVQLNHQAGL